MSGATYLLLPLEQKGRPRQGLGEHGTSRQGRVHHLAGLLKGFGTWSLRGLGNPLLLRRPAGSSGSRVWALGQGGRSLPSLPMQFQNWFSSRGENEGGEEEILSTGSPSAITAQDVQLEILERISIPIGKFWKGSWGQRSCM